MYREKLSLEGRTIVVAGAGGGGIGTAVCEAVAEAGASVVAVDIDPEALAEAEQRIGERGGRGRGVIADVRTREGAERAMAEAAAGPGPLSGLVHIVGGAREGHWEPSADYPDEAFREVMELNLDSAFQTCRAAARAMIDAGTPGSIVCLSSISGSASSPFHLPYGIAKAGIVQMVQTLAVEWGRRSIRVNAIAPGSIRTPRVPMTENPARDRAAIPLGRRGDASEIAGAALFLLSDLASYVTGQTLAVDGGATGKLSFIGADDVPVFMDDPEMRARLVPDSD